MPVSPHAIDELQSVAILLAPARPLPAAPHHPTSNRPVTGEADSPRIQQLHSAAVVRIRGPIGSTATVGGNAATIGAPGILGFAAQHKGIVSELAMDAIRAPSHLGRSVDKKA